MKTERRGRCRHSIECSVVTFLIIFQISLSIDTYAFESRSIELSSIESNFGFAFVSDDLRSARERAEIAVKSGDSRQAVQLYELWLSAMPSDTAAYARCAGLYVQLGNNERALEILRLGVSRGLADISAMRNQAQYASLRGLKGWTDVARLAQENSDRSNEFTVYISPQQRFGRYKVYLPSGGEKGIRSKDGTRGRQPYEGVQGENPDSLKRYHPVLLLHGNGQTPEVMLRWAKGLQIPDVAFICPEAPYTKVRETIADNSLRLSAAPDDIAALGYLRLSVMEASADWYFSAFLDAKQTLPLVDEKPIVIGFSQGGFYGSIIAMRYSGLVRSLVLLSASYYQELRVEPFCEKLRSYGIDVLHTHGRRDPIVAFSTAERIESMLDSGGVQHQFVPYDGEHWMSAEIDGAVRRWIQDHFAIKRQ